MKSIEEQNALYFVGWDNLSKIMRDAEASIDKRDESKLVTELCSATLFAEELRPIVNIVETDDSIKKNMIDRINSVSESTDPVSTKKALDELRSYMFKQFHQIPSKVHLDEEIKQMIDDASGRTAGVCKYIPKPE